MRLRALALFATAALGCGFDNGVVPQDGDPTDGMMVVDIDGSKLRATTSVSARVELGSLVIDGGSPFDRRVSIHLTGASRENRWPVPRTFWLTPETSDTTGFAIYTEPLTVYSFSSFNTTLPGGHGSVTITAFTAEYVEGTFTFTGAGGGRTGSERRTLSDGHFFAKFKR